MMDGVRLALAGEKDAEEIHALMEAVYQGLENKSVFVCDDFAYVKDHIATRGFIVLARNREDKLVGSFMIRFPGLQEDNLGYDIGLGAEELGKVAHLESAVVGEEYRGHFLQGRMLKEAEQVIKARGFRHLLATVSPDNPASYRTLEQSGYRLWGTKVKYQDLVRRIYYKDMEEDNRNYTK